MLKKKKKKSPGRVLIMLYAFCARISYRHEQNHEGEKKRGILIIIIGHYLMQLRLAFDENIFQRNASEIFVDTRTVEK